jgi:hypothetical protein
MFYVGQKVVCVDDSINGGSCSPRAGGHWEYPIKKGQVYIIRWVGNYVCRICGEELCVRLDGIYRGPPNDVPLSAKRFRPLDERSTETGMEMLRKLLNPDNHKVPVG